MQITRKIISILLAMLTILTLAFSTAGCAENGGEIEKSFKDVKWVGVGHDHLHIDDIPSGNYKLSGYFKYHDYYKGISGLRSSVTLFEGNEDHSMILDVYSHEAGEYYSFEKTFEGPVYDPTISVSSHDKTEWYVVIEKTD